MTPSMASKTSASALFLIFNFLFFTFATACSNCPPKYPKTSPTQPSPIPSTPTPSSPTPSTPTPSTPTPPNSPSPSPSPSPSSSSVKCPRDALKLGVCANVLGGVLNATVGTPPKEPCCSLLSGLVDLEVAVCLCTAIKANILGINLNLPIDLSLLVNYCGNKVPPGFQCA